MPDIPHGLTAVFCSDHMTGQRLYTILRDRRVVGLLTVENRLPFNRCQERGSR